MASEEHDSAVQRLEGELVEQDRLDERFDAAIGKSTELGAYVRLRAAGDQVTAREAWLHWVDDEGYRGLNAGPFELLAALRGEAADPGGGSVLQDCSFVRSHSLSSSRATPIEGPGRFEDHDEQ